MDIKKHNLYLILPLIICMGYLSFMILSHPNFIVDDCGLLLICAKKIIYGEIPYIDFIEHNPPLIYLLNIIPALINIKFGLSIQLSFGFYILVLISIFYIILYYLLYKQNKLHTEYQTLLISYLIFNALTFDTFGEREHLMVIFGSPFLLIRCLKYDGCNTNKFVSLIAGLFLSIGILTKPWYIVAYLAFEIGLKVKNNLKLPNIFYEASGFIFGGLCYLTYLLLIPQNSFLYYLNPIIKLTAAGYRHFQQNPLSSAFCYLLNSDLNFHEKIYVPVPFFFIFILIIFIYFNIKLKENVKFNLGVIFYLIISIFIFIFFPPILDYHCIPIQFSFYWLVMINLYLLSNLLVKNNFIKPNLKIIFYIFSIIFTFLLLKPTGEKVKTNEITSVYHKLTKPNEQILVLSIFPYLLPELSDRISANKYMPVGYPINEFITINNSKTIPKSILEISHKTEKDYLEYLNYVIDTQRPKLIVIQSHSFFVLDWLEYFKKNGLFDKIIKSYKVLNKNFEDFNYPEKYQECKSKFIDTKNKNECRLLFLIRKDD